MNESNGMPLKKVCGIAGTERHNKISAAISEYNKLTDRDLELNIETKSYLKLSFRIFNATHLIRAEAIQ
jgi:hypothetical protein